MATTTLARRIRRIGVLPGTKGMQFDEEFLRDNREVTVAAIRAIMYDRRSIARAKQQTPVKKNRRSRARRTA